MHVAGISDGFSRLKPTKVVVSGCNAGGKSNCTPQTSKDMADVVVILMVAFWLVIIMVLLSADHVIVIESNQ